MLKLNEKREKKNINKHATTRTTKRQSRKISETEPPHCDEQKRDGKKEEEGEKYACQLIHKMKLAQR